MQIWAEKYVLDIITGVAVIRPLLLQNVDKKTREMSGKTNLDVKHSGTNLDVLYIIYT